MEAACAMAKHAGAPQELEKMVQQARKESTKADDLVRSLTPRPNWHKLDTHPSPSSAPASAKQPHPQPEPSASTRDLVDRLVAERKQALARVAELEPLQGQLQEALRLLEPEPAPAPVVLTITSASAEPDQHSLEAQQQPAAAAIATAAPAHEAAPAGTSAGSMSPFDRFSAAGTSGSHGPDFASGLGWSTTTPRYLKWDGLVALQPMTLSALQMSLSTIWLAKAASDTDRQVQQPLGSFMWRFLRGKHGHQGLVAQAGYSLLHALQQHQHASAMACTFLRILEGRWQEAMWHDCRHMLEAVSLVLQALSERPQLLLCTAMSLPASRVSTAHQVYVGYVMHWLAVNSGFLGLNLPHFFLVVCHELDEQVTDCWHIQSCALFWLYNIDS